MTSSTSDGLTWWASLIVRLYKSVRKLYDMESALLDASLQEVIEQLQSDVSIFQSRDADSLDESIESITQRERAQLHEGFCRQLVEFRNELQVRLQQEE